MCKLTDSGLSYFMREHIVSQMEDLGMLEDEAFDADSIGEICRLSVRHGMLPVVTFVEYDRAMAAYGISDSSQQTLS